MPTAALPATEMPDSWTFSTYSALNKDYLFIGGPATTEEQALQMLSDLIGEMESRYKALAKSH